MTTSRAGASPASPPILLWTTVVYGLMVVGAIGAFLLIRSHGETLVAQPVATTAPAAAAPPPASDVFPRVLVALTAVIVTGATLAKLFARLGQPPVIGEVVAGIVLGPSVLGPEASAIILPPAMAPSLGAIAQLGVLLYMFIVGLELNADLVRRRAHATVATSHASILAPFLLGALLALGLYPRLSSSEVSFTSFALFMGVAMSITAFPVLARILADRRMTGTELGVVALSCAAADDVTAWCLLAFIVGVAKARVGWGLLVAAGTIVYIALMILLVRPILRRAAARWEAERSPRGGTTFVFVALLASALTTELLGIHAIFGAFLLGAVLPHDSAVARAFTRQLEPVVTALFLPAFFALTGMRTQIGLVSGPDQWLVVGLIILVATVGKFGGTFAAARLTGLGWRDSAALGTLMNTRGLMELVVLNIGLDLKVISPTVFTMLVLMALATTMATSPVLRWLIPHAVPEDGASRHAD